MYLITTRSGKALSGALCRRGCPSTGRLAVVFTVTWHPTVRKGIRGRHLPLDAYVLFLYIAGILIRLSVDSLSMLLMVIFGLFLCCVFSAGFLWSVWCVAEAFSGSAGVCCVPFRQTRPWAPRSDEYRAIKGLLKSALLRGRNLCSTNGSGNSILQPPPPRSPAVEARRGGAGPPQRRDDDQLYPVGYWVLLLLLWWLLYLLLVVVLRGA